MQGWDTIANFSSEQIARYLTCYIFIVAEIYVQGSNICHHFQHQSGQKDSVCLPGKFEWRANTRICKVLLKECLLTTYNRWAISPVGLIMWQSKGLGKLRVYGGEATIWVLHPLCPPIQSPLVVLKVIFLTNYPPTNSGAINTSSEV